MTTAPDPEVAPSRFRSLAAASRSVEAAALAGLVYTVCWIVARSLLLRTPSADDPGLTAWYEDPANQRLTLTALNFLSVGCVAFLWFVAVIRRRVGSRENPFFGTVFLGSALVTTGLWSVGGLLFAAPALDAYLNGATPTAAGASTWQAVGHAAFTVVAVRFQAVFLISGATVARLSSMMPRFLVVAGYVAGLVLMLAPLPSETVAWVFPSWVGLASVILLVRHRSIEAAVRTDG